MSGGGGGGTTTVREQIDPALRPFIDYGLRESRRLYQADTPSYFPDKTYVDPSQQTLSALNAAQRRAITGSPLTRIGQQTVGQFAMSPNQNRALRGTDITAGGSYLTGSPFFQGAFDAATGAARQKYDDDTQRLKSTLSRAGRYGSGAGQDLQDRTDATFAGALTDTAGKLAFMNYQNERKMQEQALNRMAQVSDRDLTRQLTAARLAPQMAMQDYSDVDRLLKIGQITEGYDESALADAIARFNFQQQRPYSKLESFLGAAYGAPRGTQTTQPIFRNRAANVLGLGGLGYGIGQNIDSGSGGNYGGQGAAIGAALGLSGLLG